MASQLTIDIADAIKAKIAAGDYSRSFASQLRRRWRPEFDLPDLALLHVTIKPRSETSEKNTRSTTFDEHRVEVVVNQRLAPAADEVADDAAIDALLDFTQELKDDLRFTAMAGAAWSRTEHEPLVDEDLLESLRVFSSAFSLYYKITV